MSVKPEKKILKECVLSKVNTHFGTKNETTGLKKYIKESKENVKTVNKFLKKYIFKTTKYKWSIGGRIDGINESETTIIEIKNRVHKLFYNLREYEKVQIFAYMFIFDKTQSKISRMF